MVNAGTYHLDHWKDDWTAVTADGRRSAQFEETILYVPILDRAHSTIYVLHPISV
jgi:hypothetical protein